MLTVNEKADKTANEMAEKVATRRCPERFALLAHVRCTISETKWKEAKNWFRLENYKRHLVQRAKYNLALDSRGPDIAAIKNAVRVSRSYF